MDSPHQKEKQNELRHCFHMAVLWNATPSSLVKA